MTDAVASVSFEESVKRIVAPLVGSTWLAACWRVSVGAVVSYVTERSEPPAAVRVLPAMSATEKLPDVVTDTAPSLVAVGATRTGDPLDEGAPFTLACYLVEGGPSREFINTKRLMHEAPDVWAALLDRLVETTVAYLLAQTLVLFALDQFCLSPQCGFASTEDGNTLSEQQQWDKLGFVVSIAKEVWG